jgi:hypothetical protein
MANSSSNVKDYGSSGAEKAKEVAGKFGEKVKDVASAVGDMASNAATAAGKKADDMASSAGSGVKHLGESIKEKGPKDGMLGTATRAVGDTLESGGKYLEEEGLSGMMEDVTGLIRRNPLPAVLVGIGIGFLIGRTLGSS